MSNEHLAWTVPVMRVGYFGRGLVYCVVAGFSLYAIWRGGEAKGTSSALSQLESTAWGGIVLLLIFLGLVAYAGWRFTDSVLDLDEHGNDPQGIVARLNMFVVAVINLALAFTALSLLFTDGGKGGGSSATSAVDTLLGLPGGRWLVGLVGLVVIVAGAHYAYKGWTEKYRNRLVSNHFTMHWNWALKAGLTAKGLIVGVVGALFIYAAVQFDPDKAGGVGEAFSWLTDQPYGQALVTLICLGLLGFALYCFVNAVYRVIPKVSGPDVKTLASSLNATLGQAAV